MPEAAPPGASPAGASVWHPPIDVTANTNDKKLADMCRSLRNQGRDPGGSWLAHVRLGYNYRLSDINWIDSTTFSPTTYNFQVRIDHQLSQKQRLYARFSNLRHDQEPTPNFFDGAYMFGTSRDISNMELDSRRHYSVALNDTIIFSPSFVGTVSYGYTQREPRLKNLYDAAPASGPPVGQGQIGRSRAHVQHGPLARRRNKPHGLAAPPAIHSPRQELIEQIVSPGDLAKHLPDAVGRLVDSHGGRRGDAEKGRRGERGKRLSVDSCEGSGWKLSEDFRSLQDFGSLLHRPLYPLRGLPEGGRRITMRTPDRQSTWWGRSLTCLGRAGQRPAPQSA